MTTTRTTLTTIRRNLTGNRRQVACLAEMLEVARKHGNEYYVERLTADLAEMDDDYDYWIGVAVDAGFGPEDV